MKQNLDILNVNLFSERSILLKRITEWITINVMDTYLKYLKSRDNFSIKYE